MWAVHRGLRAWLRRAVAQAAALVPTSGGELAIVLMDDSAIRALNRAWRGKDEATNVLSFPAPERADGRPGTRAGPRLLGDILIAYETTAREALAEGKPFMHHLAHLAVHGYLHLLGHDHASDAQAEAMERLETRILARLGVGDPYMMSEPASHPDRHA